MSANDEVGEEWFYGKANRSLPPRGLSVRGTRN